MTSQLLKCEEVAAILSISRRGAYTLVQRGELPCVRIGRNVRVRQEDLEHFISDSILPKKGEYADAIFKGGIK
jgi:excisionase family DNA binding protein